jgi:hypothetical protein
MNAFDDRFWNLDQAKAWAETRQTDSVEHAAASLTPGRARSSSEIAIASLHRATATKRATGRDINAELWKASGWPEKTEPIVFPSNVCNAAHRDGIPVWEFAFERGIVVVLPVANGLGPPHVFRLCPFPIEDYITRLLRDGRLTARGQFPGEYTPRPITADDWASYEIGYGREFYAAPIYGSEPLDHRKIGFSIDHVRLSAWRVGRAQRTGEGDIRGVIVRRDELLREFPLEAPDPSPERPKPVSDDDVRRLIRDELAVHDGYLSQNEGARIVRQRFPNFPKKRAMTLVKEATGNDKPGPRGPRKKSCG